MVVVVAGGGRLPPGTAEDALGLNIYIYIYISCGVASSSLRT